VRIPRRWCCPDRRRGCLVRTSPSMSMARGPVEPLTAAASA
jgi:hypothetical protein